MDKHVEEITFLSFICPNCHQEIEAPADTANHEAECPTCAALITIPLESAPNTVWAKPEAQVKGPSQSQIDAMKSRTIRIELQDSW